MQTHLGSWIRLIEDALDPSGRLDRAKTMGFDVSRVWYHGSRGQDIEAFDVAHLGKNTGARSALKGFFFASDPKVAVSYGGHERYMPDDAKRVHDLRAAEIAQLQVEMEGCLTLWYERAAEEAILSDRFYKGPKNKRISPEAYWAARDAIHAKHDTPEARAASARYQELAKEVSKRKQQMVYLQTSGTISRAVVFPVYLRLSKPLLYDMKGDSYREVSYNDLLISAKRGRRDGAIIKNTFDPGYRGANAPMCDIAVAFRPEQVRSVHAGFDPAKADSPNIMD